VGLSWATSLASRSFAVLVGNGGTGVSLEQHVVALRRTVPEVGIHALAWRRDGHGLVDIGWELGHGRRIPPPVGVVQGLSHFRHQAGRTLEALEPAASHRVRSECQ